MMNMKKSIVISSLLSALTLTFAISCSQSGNSSQKVEENSSGPSVYDEEKLAAIYAVTEEQDKIFVTANNKAVALLTKEIPIQGKLTSGVRIIDIRGLNAKVDIM